MGCTHVPGVEQYMKNIMRKAKANCMGTVGRKGSTSATTKQPKAVPMGRVTKRCSLSSKLRWSSKKAFKGNQYTWFAWGDSHGAAADGQHHGKPEGKTSFDGMTGNAPPEFQPCFLPVYAEPLEILLFVAG